ncbi:MAG: hypothetical protein K0R80_2261 [Clostridia bacterium]|jgi:hypothetical protein|nr:hypothetical protein [Clostridia bacterium]
MKAITANDINTSLKESKRMLANSNKTAREVVLMNLISNIMIKDNDIKKSSIENKRTNINQDHGFNLYKALEFSMDHPKKTSHNLQMELICSRLI